MSYPRPSIGGAATAAFALVLVDAGAGGPAIALSTITSVLATAEAVVR